MISIWKKRHVWLTLTAVNSQMFIVANIISWTSAAIPKLKRNGHWDLYDEESQLGNFLMYGTLCGSVISFFLLSYAPRKASLILNELFFLICWILMFFKNNLLLLYIGRFFGGISASTVALTLPAYEAETFHPGDRQISGGIMCLFMAGGLMLEYTLAPIVSYNSIIIINIVPIVLFLAFFIHFGKETPYHKYKVGQIKEAEKILWFFWKHDAQENEMIVELKNIEDCLNEDKDVSRSGLVVSMLKEKGPRKAVLLSFGLIAFYSACGSIQITMYMEPIITAANVTEISPAVSSAVIGSVKPIGALVSLPLISMQGAKRSLVITLAGCLIGLTAIGGYFFAQYCGLDTKAIYWIPLTSMTVFFFCGLMGASILPYILRGELLPRKLRGPGGASTDILASLFAIAAQFIYTGLADSKLFAVFWIYGALTLAQMLFVFIFVPETKDKDLQEIQDILKGNHMKPGHHES